MSDLRSMGAWHVRASSTLGWLLAALLLLATSTAVAQPSKKSPEDRGKELAVEGLTLYQANKFKEALVKFEEAETHYPTAQVLRMKGYALVGMQRWVEAAESIEGALKNELKPLMPADAEDAEDQLKDVLSHVATVTIKAAVPIATVRVDGGGARELPQTLRLNVGSHRFVVEAKNRETLDSLHDVVAGPSTLTLTPGISKAKPIDKVTRKIDDDEEAESKRGDDEERRRPKKDPDDKEAEDDAAAEEAKKRAAEKEAEDAETEERTPSKKPSAPSAGLFPHQVPVGLALMGVGVAAAAVGAGTGGYGLSLNHAVEQNIGIHQQHYDIACSTYSELCRADITLINRDGERAASLRNLGMITGIAGGSVALIGAGLWLFAPSSTDARTPDSAPTPPRDAGLITRIGCSGMVLPAASGVAANVGCVGSF